MHPQLPLSFEAEGAKTFSAFYAGPNFLPLQILQDFAEGQHADLQQYIWGESGVGKTHLLNACCHAAAAKGFRIAYIPASVVSSAEMFEGLGESDLVCIDDLDQLPAVQEIELGLFSLFNTLHARGGRMLLASACALQALPVKLPDLRTRLGWGASYRLHRLEAADVRAALKAQASTAGLLLDDNVIEYMMTHLPRDIDTQTDMLKQLDRASMQTKRRITIPLLREVLTPQSEQI